MNLNRSVLKITPVIIINARTLAHNVFGFYIAVMNQFLAEIHFPVYMSNELIDVIPKQRALVNKLFQQGIISTYSLALDRSKLWVIFNCASESEAVEYLEKFPIASHVEYIMHELAFSEQQDYSISTMSLN